MSIALKALVNVTPRDARLLRALADCALVPFSVAAKLFPSVRTARDRVYRLKARGLLSISTTGPGQVAGRRRCALLHLTPAGAEVAAALGCRPPTPQELRAAAVLAPAVAAVAEAYFVLRDDIEAGEVEWVRQPDLPLRGGVVPPEGAWALARRVGDGRVLVFDLDRPGRPLGDVARRLTTWSAWCAAGGTPALVCYVVPDAARRARVADLAPEHVVLDHPARVAGAWGAVK